jgi:hypothetical protein
VIYCKNDLTNVYDFLNISDGVIVGYVEEKGVHRVLVGKPERKRPFGRPRRRWEDNIKMDFQEVGGGYGTGWS